MQSTSLLSNGSLALVLLTWQTALIRLKCILLLCTYSHHMDCSVIVTLIVLDIHLLQISFTAKITNNTLASHKIHDCISLYTPYTGCHRRNGPNFGRVFLMLNYTDTTQNTYIQSWTVTEIMAREVWNFDSCHTLIDYQIHIKTGRNMWFV